MPESGGVHYISRGRLCQIDSGYLKVALGIDLGLDGHNLVVNVKDPLVVGSIFMLWWSHSSNHRVCIGGRRSLSGKCRSGGNRGRVVFISIIKGALLYKIQMTDVHGRGQRTIEGNLAMVRRYFLGACSRIGLIIVFSTSGRRLRITGMG
jgi:hypothetical protein